MTNRHWALVEVAARLLEPGEREAVLGDLLETGEGAWRGSLDVLGLVILRQLLHWKSWQPWLAAFGLALPGSLLLMGISVSVSSMCVRLIDLKIFGGSPQVIHGGFLQLLCGALLLVGCSWACGFVMGSLSRRTLWVSIASSCFACSFCLVRVQGAISLEALPVSFSSARHLRNSPGLAVDSDQLGFSDLSGNRNHVILDSSIEQQKLMGFELVPGLARVVHRCNKHNERAKKLERSQWKMQ